MNIKKGGTMKYLLSLLLFSNLAFAGFFGGGSGGTSYTFDSPLSESEGTVSLSESDIFTFSSPLSESSGTVSFTAKKAIDAATLGMIHNACMTYTDTDTVTFPAGMFGECNGSYFEITEATTSDIASPSGADFYYFYVDDSESSYPTPTIINATTEPAYSATKKGWYNGNDRCIGAVFVNGSNVIEYFESMFTGGTLKIVWNTPIQIASDMNPDASWQTPDDSESSVYLPVNSKQGLFRYFSVDADSASAAAITTYEMAQEGGALTVGYQYLLSNNQRANQVAWVSLGASRNVRISASDDDDNNLSLWIKGFEVEL